MMRTTELENVKEAITKALGRIDRAQSDLEHLGQSPYDLRIASAYLTVARDVLAGPEPGAEPDADLYGEGSKPEPRKQHNGRRYGRVVDWMASHLTSVSEYITARGMRPGMASRSVLWILRDAHADGAFDDAGVGVLVRVRLDDGSEIQITSYNDGNPHLLRVVGEKVVRSYPWETGNGEEG